jgi:carboxylate-amine ligase
MVTATFGVEEEFFVADRDTGELREDAETILATARERFDDEIEHELRAGMVEAGTAVCPDTGTLRQELLRRRRAVADGAVAMGARALACGTHPTAKAARVGYGDDDRYRRMAVTFGRLADDALTCGCHVHVAVPSPQIGVRVIDRIGGWLPVLLAISANSPLWEGEDTGFDSWRARVWSRWPSAGPTTTFGSLGDYEQRAEELIAIGAAIDRGMLYYDARLAERYPTVEIRVADVCTDVEDAVLLAALARALVVTAITEKSQALSLPVELTRAASFAAARWGLGGRLVNPRTGRAAPADDVADALIEEVRDALDDAGDTELVVDGLGRARGGGNGAARQRAAFERGGPPAVLDLVTVR